MLLSKHFGLLALLLSALLGFTSNTFAKDTITLDKIEIVKQDKKTVTVKVFFKNENNVPKGAYVHLMLLIKKGKNENTLQPAVSMLKKGDKSKTLILKRFYKVTMAHTTNYIHAGIYIEPEHNLDMRIPMFAMDPKTALADAMYDIKIDWPAYSELELDDISPENLKKITDNASNIISSADKSSQKFAKEYLDKVLYNDPKYIPAHIQLARYYMVNQGAVDGYHKAREILENALTYAPNNANVYVLLGFACVHTNDNKAALKAFEKAEQIGTDNLWLYTNWGEMYLRENNEQAAIKYYTKAIKGENKSYDNKRAMADAFAKLMPLLKKHKNKEQLNEILLLRDKNFPIQPCFRMEHAILRIQEFSDVDTAEKLSQEGLSCTNEGVKRTALALVYYLRWTQLKDKTPEAAQDYYTKAKFLGAHTASIVYMSAYNKYTFPIIKALIKEGFDINKIDPAGINPFLLAFRNNQPQVAENLIQLGADPNITINEQNLTPIMIASYYGNTAMVKVLLANGADLTQRTTDGLTAASIAKQQGHAEIIKLFQEKLKI